MNERVNELDLVEEVVPIRGRDFVVARPRDADALLTEEAFDREEFMPYWAELWASGRALASVVYARSLRGASVLELARANAVRNEVEVSTLELDWFAPPESLPWFDLVIAADVLYEARNGAALLDLLPSLTREVWIADAGRAAAGRFFADAVRDWEVRTSAHSAVPDGGVYRLRRR